MTLLKPGQKLKSAVCDTQIMVIKAISGDWELTCGGVPMIGANEPSTKDRTALQPDKAGGTLIGKRYVNDDESLELLCVKGGVGSLLLDGAPLTVRKPKALPTSD